MQKLLLVSWFIYFPLFCSDVVEDYYQEKHIIARNGDYTSYIGKIWISSDVSKRNSVGIVSIKDIERDSQYKGFLNLDLNEPLEVGSGWRWQSNIEILIVSITSDRIEVNLMYNDKNILKP